MKKNISIWIVNGVMNAGGTESLIMNMFKYKSKDIDYRLIIHYQNEEKKHGIWDDQIRQLGIPISYLPSVGSVGIKRYKKDFAKLLSTIGKPDIIHIHLNAVGGIIARIAKKNKIKYRIVHCHAKITYNGNYLKKFFLYLKLEVMKIFVKINANYQWACSIEAAWARPDCGIRSLWVYPAC